MKAESDPAITVSKLAPRCEGTDQFANFDKLFRAVIAVPKQAIERDEAKWKQAQARKKQPKRSAKR